MVIVAKVEVTDIKFDHTTGDTGDGINIRTNNSTDINVPEWVKGGQNKPAAYKKNTAVTIKAKFSVSPTTVTSAKIRAVLSSGTFLGNLGEQTVTFTNGVSSYVSFTPANSTPSSVTKSADIKWQWKAKDLNGTGTIEHDINESGPHSIYIVLDTPQDPMAEPWTEALDYACDWAAGANSEASAIIPMTTNAYNNFGKDYYGGGTHAESTTLNLTSLLTAVWADCRDMSATVHVFMRAIGGTTTDVRIINGVFWYQKIDPVGSPDGPTWVDGAWNFHQVANYSNVYDACLRLDESSPRIPTDEAISGGYKDDLFSSGTWSPQTAFDYTTVQ